MQTSRKLLALSTLVLACTEPQAMEPYGPGEQPVLYASSTNTPVYWNEVARALVIRRSSSPFHAARTYALVSVAQHNAAVAATSGGSGNRNVRLRAAITRASVAMLTYVYPDEAAVLDSLAGEFLSGTRVRDAAEVQTGDSLGAAVAAPLIERAKTDGFFEPWTGTVPTGPGVWYSSTVPPTPPAMARLGEAKTFLLQTGSQFRPGPPPAFGSAEFRRAVEEVRHFADTRTPQQDSLARFWALPGGTYTPFGYWNEEASELAKRYQLSEIRTAHLLALMNIVGADAVIASHDAKYTYWLLRPSQADTGIRTAIGLPNFPSYVSNHATLSGGMARIIGEWFPSERRRLNLLADEAAMSRLFGGIHYRFDNEAGLQLGRTIAAYAIMNDVGTGEPFVLR